LEENKIIKKKKTGFLRPPLNGTVWLFFLYFQGQQAVELMKSTAVFSFAFFSVSTESVELLWGKNSVSHRWETTRSCRENHPCNLHCRIRA